MHVHIKYSGFLIVLISVGSGSPQLLQKLLVEIFHQGHHIPYAWDKNWRDKLSPMRVGGNIFLLAKISMCMVYMA